MRLSFPFRIRRKKEAKTKEPQRVSAKSARPNYDHEHAAELSPALSSAFDKLGLEKEKINSTTLERNNEFIFGTVAGMVGATVKYGFNELMQVLNIAQYDNNATSITVVMKSYEYSPVFWIFGFINALIIGAFFGVVIAFIMSYIFSERHSLLKGAGIGVGIWLFNLGFAARVFYYPEPLKHSLGDVVSLLFSLIIYAVVTVYVLKRLGFFAQSK